MGESELREPGTGNREQGTGNRAQPSERRSYTRLSDDGGVIEESAIAVEVPVAFIYGSRSHVVMMCTPTDFEDLAVGFTLSEEIVGSATDIGDIVVQRHERGVELSIAIPQAAQDTLRDRARAISARTGCGLCGVEAIDDAVRAPHTIGSSLTFSKDALWKASASLDARQPHNRETHAIHAAAWATPDGELKIVREDVGRHNALDKVLGALTRTGTDARNGFLIVTSRASFELVQKAAVFGVPMLAAVSRPTALAINIAESAGMCLVGLLRGKSANVYSRPERISA